MRAALKKYRGKSRSGRFSAKIELIEDDGRILLKDVKNSNLKLVTDHCWYGMLYWFADFLPAVGQVIQFWADVGLYKRDDGSYDLKPKDLREIKQIGG